MNSPRFSSLRLFLLGVCFFTAAGLGALAARPEQVGLPAPLTSLPNTIDSWTGQDAPFAPEVTRALGVDDYVHRVYASGTSQPISFYVGYYASQRTGDTIHSPANCLPGAGWLPVRSAQVSLVVPGRATPITVNRLLIQKGLDRQVVLYWYQSHGRVVASDYWSKAYLVWDAARHGRSDAAMVRVITPLAGGQDAEDAANDRAARFIEMIFPALDRLLPV
jgi:EpsI family protein